MIHKSISDHFIVMDKGEGDEEWMLIKCNAFEKPIIFGVVYNRKAELHTRILKPCGGTSQKNHGI